MTSARTLGAIFALSLLLSGCFDQSSKPQAWNVEPDGTESTFGVPAQIQQKVEIANVFARVTLDGVGQGDMELDGDVGRIRLSDIAPGNHTIVVHFYYNDGGTLVSLAEASKAVEIIAGQTATLTILETDYVFTDSDNDGISNADEIDQGTNYNDINDPVDQNSSSVGASSSEDVSSSSEQSISSDDSVSSVENSSIGVSSSDVGSDSSVESSNSSIAGSSSSTPIITPSSVSVSSSSSESVDSSSSDQSSSSSNGNNPQNIFTIDAGDDVVVSEGDLVELKVEVANTTGVATYRWTADFSGLDLQGATTDTLSFQTGNYTQNQTITFEVSVTSGGETLLDEVVVQINAENEPPVVTFENTQLIVAPDAAVALAPFSVTDPEGEPLTFTWEEALANPVMVGLVVDGSSASFTAPALSSADETLVLTFTFTAFDGERSAMQTVTVTVQDDNDTPVARITTVDDVLTVAENASLVLSGLTSTDLYTAAENLTYQWALESNFVYDLGITDWNSPALTINAPNLADDAVLQFSLVVTDDSTPALSSIKTFIDITIDAENNPAVLTLGRSAGSAEPGEQGITLTATATDPDLDQASLTYTFEWQNPAGFDVLNATTGEQVTFDAPSDLLEDTNLEFTVNATQVGTGALPIVSDSISVLIGGFAPPTAVAALANAMVTPSEAAAFNVTAAGSLNGTNPISSYSWSTSCDGNLANAAAAVATFTPKNRAANDVCSFTLEVSDGSAEGTVSDTLDVTIVATDEPPVLAPLATINTTANQPVSLDASAANDPENTALTFSWSTTSGVVLTGANTATASFTAPDSDEPQTLTFTVTVADGNPDNNLERNVTVEVAGNNAAPTAVITSLPGDSVGENTPVTLSGETSNDSHTASTALEYQWEQLSPTVAALDLGITDWQSASLSFTSPDLAADQVVTFGLTVTDSQGEPSTQDTYALTLEGVNNAPTVEVTASQNAVAAGATVTLTATAFNSDSDQQAIGYTYSWTAPAGFESLLAGLSAAELSSSEIVVTMPTDLSADVTPLIFTVTATEDITDGLTSEPAQTTITVGQGYVPPVAGIALVGGGSTITEGVAATFSAASSQLGTDVPVTYNWSTDCPGAFDSTSGVQVSFTGDNLTASISCEVIVSIDDNSGNAAVPVNARLPVTLSANNDAPVTTGPAAPIDAIARMPVALEGFTVSDVDTDEAELTYEWTADVAGAEAWLSDTAALTPTLLAPPSPEDVPVIYTLRALDGGEAERTAAENATAVASVTVNIANNNDNPRAAIRLVMPASVTDIAENLAVNLVAEPVAGATRFDNFSDANELTFTWTPNAALQALGVMPASATGLDTYSFSLPNLEQPLADMNVSLVVRDPHGGISSTYDFPFAIKAENDEPSIPTISGPESAVGGEDILLEASGSTDPEGLAVTYSWQEVDALGSPVIGGVACDTTTATTCEFTAPDEERTLILQAIASDGVKQSVNSISIALTKRYVPWDFNLVVTSTAPVEQPDFDAIEEQAEIVVALEAVVVGSDAIQVYDWSASTCSYTAPTGQPFTNPTVSDFTIFEESAELRFTPITFVSQSYSCVIQLIIDDGQGAPINRQLDVDIFADNDPAVAVAGVFINGVATEVSELTVNAGDVIEFAAVIAGDDDTLLRQGDIWWRVVETAYAPQFEFQSEIERDPTLIVPSIPQGAEVTVRLTVNGVFDDIALTVNPSDTEDPVASAELVTASVLDNSIGVQIRSTSTDDTGIETYLWSSNTPEISFTTNDQAVGVFDVAGMPTGGVATITLMVTDLAGKTASVNVPVTVEPSYVAWEFELIATPSSPEEEQEVTVEMNVLTQGTKTIAEYNWSESICNDPFSGGTYPVTSDFSGFENSLVFTLLNRVTDYTCELKLIVTEEDVDGVPGAVIESPVFLLNVSADDDPARMVIATLVGGEPVAVDAPINVNSGDSIVLDASLSRDDTNFASYDWSFTDDTNSLFDFDINTPNRQVTLEVPVIPEGGEFTIQLQANLGTATATLIVAPLPAQEALNFVNAQGSEILGDGSYTAEVFVGDEAFILGAVGGSGAGIISYRSSNPFVASVDSQTGLVSPGSRSGSVVITAEKLGGAAFQNAKATYVVDVLGFDSTSNGLFEPKSTKTTGTSSYEGVQEVSIPVNVGVVADILNVGEDLYIAGDAGVSRLQLDGMVLSGELISSEPTDYLYSNNRFLFAQGESIRAFEIENISNNFLLPSSLKGDLGSVAVNDAYYVRAGGSGPNILALNDYILNASAPVELDVLGDEIIEAENRFLTSGQSFGINVWQEDSLVSNGSPVTQTASSELMPAQSNDGFVFGLIPNSTTLTAIDAYTENAPGYEYFLPINLTPDTESDHQTVIVGNRLYIAGGERYVEIVDISGTESYLYNVGRIYFKNPISRLSAIGDTLIAHGDGEGTLSIIDTKLIINVPDKQHEAKSGDVLVYPITWGSPNSISSANCEVTAGKCTIVDKNFTTGSARVVWQLPVDAVGTHHGIKIIVSCAPIEYAEHDWVTLVEDNRSAQASPVLGVVPVSANVDDTFDFDVTAGGEYIFTSSNTSVARVNASTGRVEFVGGGNVRLTLIRFGNDSVSPFVQTFDISVSEKQQTISFIDSSDVETFVGDPAFTKAAVFNGEGNAEPIVYSSSNELVAKVDSVTGQVMPQSREGAAVIKATKADGDGYEAAEVSYIVNVASYKGGSAELNVDESQFLSGEYRAIDSRPLSDPNTANGSQSGRLLVDGELVFAVRNNTIEVWKVSPQGQLSKVQDVPSVAALSAATFADGLLYVSRTNEAVDVYSIDSSSNSPLSFLGAYILSSRVTELHVFGKWLLLGTDSRGLLFLDRTSGFEAEIHPVVVGVNAISSSGGAASASSRYIAADDTHVYYGTSLNTFQGRFGLNLVEAFDLNAPEGARSIADVYPNNDSDNIGYLLGLYQGFAFAQDRDKSTLDVLDLSNLSNIQTTGINLGRTISMDNFSAKRTDIQGSNFYAIDYISNTTSKTLVRFDIQDPLSAAISGEVSFRDGLGTFVSMGEIGVGLNSADSTIFTVPLAESIIEQPVDTVVAQDVKIFPVSWNVDNVEHVSCSVSAGSCQLTNVNLSSQTAEVVWLMPDYHAGQDNHHELKVVIGGAGFYFIDRDWVRLIQDSRAAQTGFNVSGISAAANIGDQLTIGAAGGQSSGEVVFLSSNPVIATVDTQGRVNFLADGDVTLTVIKLGDENFAPATRSIVVSVQTAEVEDLFATYSGARVVIPDGLFTSGDDFLSPSGSVGSNVDNIAVGNGVVYALVNSDPKSLQSFRATSSGALNFGNIIDSVTDVDEFNLFEDQLVVISTPTTSGTTLSRFGTSVPVSPAPIGEILEDDPFAGSGGRYFATDKYIVWVGRQGPPNGERKVSIALIADTSNVKSFTPLQIDISSLVIEGDVLYINGTGRRAQSGTGDTDKASSVRVYDLTEFDFSIPDETFPADQVDAAYKGIASENLEFFSPEFTAEIHAAYKGFVIARMWTPEAGSFQILDLNNLSDIPNAPLVYESFYASSSTRDMFLWENVLNDEYKLFDWNANNIREFDVSNPALSFVSAQYNVERSMRNVSVPCNQGRLCHGASATHLYIGAGGLESYDIRGRLTASEKQAQARLGEDVLIPFSWGSTNSTYISEFTCVSSAGVGSCRVDMADVDFARRTGTARLTLPFVNDDDNPDGHYEVIVLGGSKAFFVADQVLVKALP